MDHIGILKQAFNTTIKHPALWILGFIWALVGGGGFGGGGNPGSGVSYQFDNGQFNNLEASFFNPAVILTTIAVLCCLVFFLIIIVAVINYVLRAGVMRLIHIYDAEGKKPTVRGGFREGWRRRTWRLFFQDLVIFAPVTIIILLLLVFAAMPLLLLLTNNEVASVIGVIGTIGLVIGWIIVVIAAATLLGVLAQFWQRAAVIGDQSTGEAIRSGWRLARNNLGDVAIMWLLMLGIGILWAMLMFPFMLVVIAMAGVVAVGPAFLIYEASASLAGALLWGIPVGILLFVVPIAFVTGLYLIFRTAVWNQVYDQLVERTGLSPTN